MSSSPPRCRACAGFFGRRVGDLRHGDAELLGDHAHGFGEGDVLDLLDEGENIASGVAAEAVKELVAGVNRERRSLFLVKRTKPGVVLRAGLAQLDVLAHDADDVGLLLDGGGEVAGLGHGHSVPHKARQRIGNRCEIRGRNSLGKHRQSHFNGQGVSRQLDSEQANFRVARHPSTMPNEQPPHGVSLLS